MSDTESTQADESFDLASFTPYRAAVVAQLLSEGLAREYRTRFGISIPDWRVLVHLAHSGGASVRDIEQQVVMEKSKVSRTVARLESRGLVARAPHPDDKRLLKLSLTDAGEDLMNELRPLAQSFQARIEATLGENLATFEQGLDTLWTAFAPKG